MILDTVRLRDWREEYLKSVASYREQGYLLVYLDETWYDSHDCPDYAWQRGDEKIRLPTSRGKRFIILHAGKQLELVMTKAKALMFCWLCLKDLCDRG